LPDRWEQIKMKFCQQVTFLKILKNHTDAGSPWFTSTHLWPEWTSSHQCTSWSFCPLDGLRFFIRHQMGFIAVHFFLLLIITFFHSTSNGVHRNPFPFTAHHCNFFSFGLFFFFFLLDLTSHITTLLTFLPS
jgi:hypothetical protein